MVPAAVVSMGKKRGSTSAAISTALYPQTVAMEESASILCARVVRGIISMRKGSDARAGNFLDNLARSQRPQKADQNLIAAHEREIGFAGALVRSVAEHLHDDIGVGEYGGAVGRDFRAFFGIYCVRIACFVPCILFDQNFQPGFGEIRNYGRNQRYPLLTRETFFGNADDHNAYLPSIFKNSPPGPADLAARNSKALYSIQDSRYFHWKMKNFRGAE